MKKTLLCATLFALFSALPASASVKSGVKLGQVHLADVKDRDTIVLPHCRVSSNKKISKIGFRVTKYAAEIDHMKLVFHNGEKQTLNVKDHFSRNSTSRWIDLKGDNRCIAKIVVKGDTDTVLRRPGKQAKVAFFGK